MSNKDKILAALLYTKLCDDCLSNSSSVKPRQTVYTICRSLSESSIIYRYHGICDHCHKTKTTNRLLIANGSESDEVFNSYSTESKHTTWYWEGNVQSKVVGYLAINGHTIHSVSDTASRTPGKDIIASKDGKEFWISVKGYPEKSQHVQARHWFSGAIFDLVLYHGENSKILLGIALPDGFTTYENLVTRIRWLKESMPFRIYWVNESGVVRVE
ncbi:hypothetical protein AB432_004105 [Brevibacillus brevis]|uniref:Uncharacterized protein n=1 Tax=Brevibacillus brevis TaxID=1393 RepID=A0A2Z4MCS4_BREBE|nr:hypothetical protein [Brevibacillus brevis]AWX54270.1 hypothetical protein AB432_004105 [Brevibacillus brevis]